MSINYDDLRYYLQHNRKWRPLADAPLDVPPSIPVEPPLDVEEALDNVVFVWNEQFNPWRSENLSNSVLLVMAATAVELYLDLFAPPPEEGTNPAWRLVNGIFENPSDPNVRNTERERSALLDGYREFQEPWRHNRYIRDALRTLLDSAGRMKWMAGGDSSELNSERARGAAINTIYSSIRALAAASHDMFLPLNIIMAEVVEPGMYYRPDDDTWTEGTRESIEFAAIVFREWIERWWNRVQRRLAFIDPYTLTLSGRLL